jgi:hypothetical protein
VEREERREMEIGRESSSFQVVRCQLWGAAARAKGLRRRVGVRITRPIPH